MQAHHEEIEHVMEHISEKGPVRAAEFARTDGKAGGWWEWKPEKRALEHLFAAGGAHDLPPRELPPRLRPARTRAGERAARLGRRPRAERTGGAAGAGSQGGTRARRRLGPLGSRLLPHAQEGCRRLLEELADEGELVRAGIEGLDEPAYVHPDNAGWPAEKVLSGGLRSSVTTLLSPFDPVVWDRARALELFDFEYKIEVYTPAARRKYGYYSSRYCTTAPSLAGSTPRPTASREPSRSRLYTSSRTRR